MCIRDRSISYQIDSRPIISGGYINPFQINPNDGFFYADFIIFVDIPGDLQAYERSSSIHPWDHGPYINHTLTLRAKSEKGGPSLMFQFYVDPTLRFMPIYTKPNLSYISGRMTIFDVCSYPKIDGYIYVKDPPYQMIIFYALDPSEIQFMIINVSEQYRINQNPLLYEFNISMPLPLPNKTQNYSILCFISFYDYNTYKFKSEIIQSNNFTVIVPLPTLKFTRTPKNQYINNIDREIEIKGNFESCTENTDARIKAIFNNKEYFGTIISN